MFFFFDERWCFSEFASYFDVVYPLALYFESSHLLGIHQKLCSLTYIKYKTCYIPSFIAIKLLDWLVLPISRCVSDVFFLCPKIKRTIANKHDHGSLDRYVFLRFRPCIDYIWQNLQGVQFLLLFYLKFLRMHI